MILFFLLLMFCSLNPYEDELTLNGETLFTEISNLEDTDIDFPDTLDYSSFP